MTFWQTWQLRAAFAQRMASCYGREVPAYNTLVDVAAEVNREVLERDGAAAQRLGRIDRVTAERHGAIRIGTPAELRAVSVIFQALGMHPVGFYDLREGRDSAVPVISTAFRPVDAAELSRNPFRMFTSLLDTDDRRFFGADLQHRLDTFLGRRSLFAPELLSLADRASSGAGLFDPDAHRFLDLATASFELSTEPVDRAWYTELERISAVAADIGGLESTHINHLTPRVLDIDELYLRMSARGITMIDAIQGPPRWAGPDLLLRQTSFRALAEDRRFRLADGAIRPGSVRVRFGEVEARGIAATPAGRDLYDAMLAEVDRRQLDDPQAEWNELAAQVWAEKLPDTELGLANADLAWFTYEVADHRGCISPTADPDATVTQLTNAGVLTLTPIVYEDFLPRSAAGIFKSNLTADGTVEPDRPGVARDAGWLSDILGRAVAEPAELYADQQAASIAAARTRLGIPDRSGGVTPASR
ncbi:MAG: hypothetical protein QOE89_718 [Pseudonocardiales bacterium]|nr:hypothetical protein [Pseudonocardiales bacterium]